MRLLLATFVVGCGGNITTKITDTSDSASEPSQPADEPSSPSSEPSAQPSSEPSAQPSSEPSAQPSSEPSSQPSSEPSGEPVEGDDYTQAGPYTVTSTSGSAQVTGCTLGMEYTSFIPQGVSNPTVVVLGHGFARGGDKMYGWGEHYASWGVEVLVPTLCHYNPLIGVDHELNGQNMVELADMHGAGQVIYAGQSAGGLAAVIAASQDEDALGVVGMDATDTEGVPGVPDFIGQGYAGNVSQTSFALVGEPSTCNSNNNGVTLFELMNTAQVFRVTSSDHCDYEKPTDWGCETFCLNQNTSFDDAQIGTAIAHLSTAAILALTGDAEAQDAWTDDALSDWISSGLLNRLR